MAKDKAGTRIRIMREAKEEFMKYGFEKASMRRIAKQAGIAPSAIYRHFNDKEALFGSFLEEMLDEYQVICEEDMSESYALIGANEPNQFWEFSDQQFKSRIRFVYRHYDAFYLVIRCAAGTRYASFIDNMIKDEVESTLELMQEMRRMGMKVNEVDETDLYLISGGFITSMCEFFLQGYGEDEALRRAHVLVTFYNNGLRSVLGI